MPVQAGVTYEILVARASVGNDEQGASPFTVTLALQSEPSNDAFVCLFYECLHQHQEDAQDNHCGF